jgi:hypothetical protein
VLPSQGDGVSATKAGVEQQVMGNTLTCPAANVPEILRRRRLQERSKSPRTIIWHAVR